MDKSKYKIATLFSGAGGLDSGFTNTKKFENQMANDILDAPAQTYSINHKTSVLKVDEFNQNPVIPCYVVGDITNVNFEPLKNIDCIIGGPPCQDFSVVRGSREELGIKMTRGNLYSHLVRALTRAQPKVFVFENVPGLRSSNGGAAYKTITEDFENLQVKWVEIKSKINKGPSSGKNYRLIFNDVVNPTDIGVPQKRKRLIIIGVREDILKKGKVEEFSEVAENLLKGKKSLLYKYPITAMEVFEGKTIPEISKKYSEVMEEYRGVEIEVGSDNALKWKSKVWDSLNLDSVDDYLKINGIEPKNDAEIDDAFEEHKQVLQELGYYDKPLESLEFEDGSNEIPKEGSSVTERMKHTPPDMNYLFVEGTKWSVKGTMSNIYRRTHPLRPAYTVMAYGGGGTWSYHYERGRSMLTNRERARLQTFPDSYLFQGNKSEVRAQIGEAVPVRLGTKLAEITQYVLEQL